MFVLCSDDGVSFYNVALAYSYLKFEVDDNGIGISDEKKKVLFNAYSDDRNVVGKLLSWELN
jgi:signal transduction histidine kinase